MNTITTLSVPAILFLFILATGFWLSRSGKPYNTVILNVHKLIALAVVIVTTVLLSKGLKALDVPPLLILLMVIAGLCAVALFASGALMSAGKLGYAAMLIVHQGMSVFAVISLAGMLFLLGRDPP